MEQYRIFNTSEELGEIARAGRKTQGLGLRAAAPRANVGFRFLSEFERGKPTAEVAKVVSAVQAAGYDLAVVKRATAKSSTDYYSKLLNTEFPYDWSNSQMTASAFIRKVLKASRFNDVLKIVSYFGFDAEIGRASCRERV